MTIEYSVTKLCMCLNKLQLQFDIQLVTLNKVLTLFLYSFERN